MYTLEFEITDVTPLEELSQNSYIKFNVTDIGSNVLILEGRLTEETEWIPIAVCNTSTFALTNEIKENSIFEADVSTLQAFRFKNTAIGGTATKITAKVV